MLTGAPSPLILASSGVLLRTCFRQTDLLRRILGVSIPLLGFATAILENAPGNPVILRIQRQLTAIQLSLTCSHSMKMDFRDVSHPRAVLGIVCEVAGSGLMESECN